MPSCLMTSRRTSATVTLSMTWSRPRTVMPLTTLVPSPTSRDARSKACCDSAALAAVPDSMTPSPTPSMRMSASGMRLLERGAHAVEIARHRDVEAGDLLAVGVEEKDVGLPDGDADHVDAARRADHRIGDLWVGDQHVLDVGRQVDGDRLADAERNEARGRLARRHLDHRHVRVGGASPGPPAPGPRLRRVPPVRRRGSDVLIAMSPVSPRLDHFGVVIVPTPKRTTFTPVRRLPACRLRLAVRRSSRR